MKTIDLTEAWVYRTPTRTIRFPAGKHPVDDTVHEAAVKAGVASDRKDKGNGGRTPDGGSQDAPDAA